LKRGGIGPAGADQFRYAAATDGNKRKLGSDEKAIRDDENEYGEDADKIRHTAIGTRHGPLSGDLRGHE
jgi:hypothetical protein